MENETKNNAAAFAANQPEIIDDDNLIEIASNPINQPSDFPDLIEQPAEQNFRDQLPSSTFDNEPQMIAAEPPKSEITGDEPPKIEIESETSTETVAKQHESKLKTPRPRADASEILHFLTVEHVALQTARAAHVADANGRAGIFVAAVFAGVIALGFAGAAVFEFSLVILPTLFFLGWATFVRVLQIALEDAMHARGANRIRHYYHEIAPEMRNYFVNSINDDRFAALEGMLVRRSFVQSLATAAGTILILNAMLLGAWLALAAIYFLAAPRWFAVIIAAGIFVVALAAGAFYQNRVWEDFEANSQTKFPSQM